MPLSPEEQRQLEEIEQALRDDDPTPGSSVGHGRARRRGTVAGVAVLFGSVVVLTGEVATQAWLGARVGFRSVRPGRVAHRFRGDARRRGLVVRAAPPLTRATSR